MASIADKHILLKDGTEVTIRSARAEDGPALRETVLEIFRTSDHLLGEADEFNVTPEQETERLKSFYDHPDKLWLVAVANGKIIGCLDFAVGGRRRISHLGEFGVSLLKSYRGLGIGRHMIRTLIDWAGANPRIEQVKLRVFAKNTSAHALYTQLGFEENGRELRGIKFSEGNYDDVISMVKHV
jgi:RimJ/RimL family protein N-acetyltransferase